jgi:putative hydrolase of the HAD superfamily
LFVDDNAANVAGAREAGLAAHRFTDLADLLRALAGHGLA